MLANWKQDRYYLLKPLPGASKGENRLVRLVEAENMTADHPACFQVAYLSALPQPAGKMKMLPKNLAQLCITLDSMGCDLIGYLRSWVSQASSVQLRMHVAILVELPIVRESGGEIVSRDIKAFALDLEICLGDVGEALGVLQPSPDVIRTWGHVIGPPIIREAQLASFEFLPMAVQFEFDPELARQASGIRGIDLFGNPSHRGRCNWVTCGHDADARGAVLLDGGR